ncbi:MAG: hypothetical protein JSU66_17680 [Deltaproteobacteria bacterium]|nr:MAG: hypothetical protein JSU66_17680 [Deltaproteobacteria bacterium]
MKVRGGLLAGAVLGLLSVSAPGSGRAAATKEGAEMAPEAHFTIVSDAASPSLEEIDAYLDRTWTRFRDLFAVEPAPVRVVLTVAESEAATRSQTDQRSEAADAHVIAWMLPRGEGLDGQSLSDLSHEIAHMYFLDVMGNPGGLHQEHAWLHEAVACYHEADPFRNNRRQWMRDHLEDRVPLAQLFEMQNPVKVNPLVELTARLHGQLAKGEITVTELNQQISAYASSHASELVNAGVRNMTYYSQSLSVFEFLLEREGEAFIRTMAQKLRDGETMESIVRGTGHYAEGIDSLENAWLEWSRARS